MVSKQIEFFCTISSHRIFREGLYPSMQSHFFPHFTSSLFFRLNFSPWKQQVACHCFVYYKRSSWNVPVSFHATTFIIVNFSFYAYDESTWNDYNTKECQIEFFFIASTLRLCHCIWEVSCQRHCKCVGLNECVYVCKRVYYWGDGREGTWAVEYMTLVSSSWWYLGWWTTSQTTSLYLWLH